MSLSHSELRHLVEEVAEIAVPAGVQKVYERDANAIVLQLRGRGHTRFLLVDTTPGFTRLHLVATKPRQPAEPTSFVMLLRKHLVGAVVTNVSLATEDRIIRIELERRTEEGTQRCALVAELTGRHGNAFLLGSQDRILGVGHHSTDTRALRPGGTWSAPPAPPKVEPDARWGLAQLPIGERWQEVAPHFADELSEKTVEGARSELRRALTAEAKRVRRLIRNVEGDLARAEEAQSFRRWGELLQSAYGSELPRGAASVQVPDYWEPDAPLVEVPLDPARSLKANIERYFHEYRRLHDATGRIEERLLEAMDRIDRVEAARSTVESAPDDELTALRQTLESEGLLGNKPRQQRRAQKGPRIPYRTFRARNGAAILLGRGSKDNDVLTTKIARGRDVWLHARDWPGSHVVLRMTGDDPPDGDALLDAALLAAHFSKGREDSLVDITYTRAKHVRKPKGAAAGLVTVAGGSTIAVSPDPARLERLLASEEL